MVRGTHQHTAPARALYPNNPGWLDLVTWYFPAAGCRAALKEARLTAKSSGKGR